MPNRPRRRSLYWRIAIGFVVVVGFVLLAQALLFVWLTGRATGAMLARSPVRFAALVAADVSTAWERDPTLDLGAYLQEQFGSAYLPIVVMTEDGRMFTNRPFTPPRPLLTMARRQFRRLEDFEGAPGLRRRRPADVAPIRVGREVRGLVLVPPQPPPSVIALREMGPTLIVGGLGFLLVGTALVALIVFAPARRRLRALESAAEAIGAGRADVRAPESGSDEVSDLARAFNRMAADLEARARALEASDRTRRRLLADVSHELSTPLSAIRGYVETLSMPSLALDEDTRRRSLQIIAEETERLEQMVGDLLDLARLEGGGWPIQPEPVSVEALFDRVADRHQPRLREQDVTLEQHIAPEAGAVWGDPVRLEQALQNLAVNAVRHTPRGGRIVLGARRHTGRIAITVRDTGAGIPPEHQPYLFDRFYKADAARADTSGSGLGLSIVKAIVEQHGGRVTAANHPDGGAVFEMLLNPGETPPAARD